MSRKTEIILFISIIALTLVTRLLHLFNSSYYYIINADSFWFHRQAELAHLGHGFDIWGSGLVTFLVCSPDIMTILVPVVLAFLIMFMIYILTKALYSKPIAIYSLVTFVLLIPCIFITEAGNVDRDALILFLFIPIMVCIYGLVSKRLPKPTYILGFIALTLLLAILWAPEFWRVGDAYSYGASEMGHITLEQLVVYVPAFMPLALGVRYLIRRSQSQDKYLLVWLLLSVVVGCIIARMMLFALPVICIVSGIGIVEIGTILKKKSDYIVTYACVGMIIAMSLIFSWKNFEGSIMPGYYVEACEYIKDNTSEDSVVLTWWSNGNWIYGVAERDTFVMNTGKGHSKTFDRIVAHIYSTDYDYFAYNLVFYELDDSHSDYIVFSSIEGNYFDTIYSKAEDNYHKAANKEGTLWYRALQEDYQSKYFDVVYRGEDIVVLGVKD